MLNNTYTQLLGVEHPSTPDQQLEVTSTNMISQPIPESSPYWTPIALYYLEREAEWARG